MVWVATHNLQNTQHLVEYPSRKKEVFVKGIPPERLQAIFRFQAAELNRHYFAWWEIAQLVIGVGTGVVLLFATTGNRLVMTLVTAMFAITVVQHLTITPQIIDIGRGLDFAGPDDLFAERRAFRSVHTTYSVLELIKLGAGLTLAGRLLYSTRERRRRRRSNSTEDGEVTSTPANAT